MNSAKDKILYVEDDYINAFIVGKMLKDHEVVIAKTCEDALDMFDSSISVVIMDINLGDARKDGVYCLRMIREHCSPNVPIIALTAYAMPGDRERFLTAGFDAYLSKPIERTMLLEAIEQVVQRI